MLRAQRHLERIAEKAHEYDELLADTVRDDLALPAIERLTEQGDELLRTLRDRLAKAAEAGANSRPALTTGSATWEEFVQVAAQDAHRGLGAPPSRKDARAEAVREREKACRLHGRIGGLREKLGELPLQPLRAVHEGCAAGDGSVSARTAYDVHTWWNRRLSGSVGSTSASSASATSRGDGSSRPARRAAHRSWLCRSRRSSAAFMSRALLSK